MSGSSTKSYAGIDVAIARQQLEGLVVDELDRDFLASDVNGNVAVFLGAGGSPLPRRDQALQTAAALEAIAREIVRPSSSGAPPTSYRTAASRARKPIFDTPRAAPQWPLHERPFQGYPHLVIASDDGAATVSRIMTELGGWEVLTREAFGVAIEVIGWISYDELHESGACSGCRVLDNPEDPQLRGPAALATAGLYVYGFTSAQESRGTTGAGTWSRIASPSAPVDVPSLQDMIRQRAPFEELALSFEDTRFLSATSGR